MHSRVMRDWFGRVAVAAAACLALAWLAVLWAAPGWRVGSPRERRLAAVVYLASAHVCHQRPERSWHRAGGALPVCARCCGAYMGAAAGLLLFSLSRRNRRGGRRLGLALVLALLPTAGAAMAEWTGAFDVGNLGRTALAIPPALLAAWAGCRSLMAAATSSEEWRGEGVN